MKVKDNNGREHNFPPTGCRIFADDARPRSQYHIYCRALLAKIYPLDIILEEVPIPGYNLFLDFYLPNLHLAIEVNGSQHSEYSSFFYKTKENFYRSKNNDNRKQVWCKENGIELIVLQYKEQENWEEQICKRL